MTNLFQDNAYNVLGIDTSVTPKDIVVRSQKIVSLLKSQSDPEFSLDIDLCRAKRTLESVETAAQTLQMPISTFLMKVLKKP